MNGPQRRSRRASAGVATFRRLRSLTSAELVALASAGAVVWFVRLSLWLLPTRFLLRRVFRRATNAPAATELTPTAKRIGWAVTAVSRRVPYATCLTQALATQVLLARAGYGSELRIGVARENRHDLLAHAWVEVGGQTLIGGESADRYQRLPDIRPILTDTGHARSTVRPRPPSDE
jgi:hypothetical protein